MKKYKGEAAIEAFCEKHKRVIDNMIYESIQANLATLKKGWQSIYSLFKMNNKDNAIYLMFVDVNRKDETNIHCDIVSITRYENAMEYNSYVDLAETS